MPGILSSNRDSDDSQSTGSDSEYSEPENIQQRLPQRSLPPQSPPQSPQARPTITQNQRSRNVARRGRRFNGPR